MYIKVELIRKDDLTGRYIPQPNVDDFCRQLGLPSAKFLRPFSKIEFTFDRPAYFPGFRDYYVGDRAIIHFISKG